jgi:hypothetical protein
MKEHQYIIGAGYHARHSNGDAMAWFFDIWWENTKRYTQPFATYVIATGDGRIPDHSSLDGPEPIYWLPVLGDLGHCGDLLSGKKPYHFSGGTSCWMTLAMLAYINECDFIFKEQDLLAFGPYVEAMYDQIGNKGCIFGSQRAMPCANSLVLVKHWFIPEMLRLYLGTAKENSPDQMAECKFVRLEKEHPDKFCRYSFGVDRDRPFDMDARFWYAQKFTPEELLALRSAELIEFDSLPANVQKFTNCV